MLYHASDWDVGKVAYLCQTQRILSVREVLILSQGQKPPCEDQQEEQKPELQNSKFY